MGFGAVAAGAIIASVLLFALALTLSITWASLHALSSSLREARLSLRLSPRLVIVNATFNTTTSTACMLVANDGPREALLSNGTIVILDYYDLSLGDRTRYIVEYRDILVKEIVVDNETIPIGLQGYTLSLMPNSMVELCFNIPSTLDPTSPIVLVFSTTRGVHSSMILIPG